MFLDRKLVGVLATLAAAISIAALASAAPASAASFKFESSPSWLKGERELENFWTSNGGFIKNGTTVAKSAEITGASAVSITLHPEYGSVSMGSQPATVVNTGCDLVFTPSSASAGSVAISCSGTSKIVYTQTSSGCTIAIPGQTPTTPTVSYVSRGSGATRTVSVTFSVSGVTYTSSGGPCGSSGTNGKLGGALLIAAFGSSSFTGQHGLWIE